MRDDVIKDISRKISIPNSIKLEEGIFKFSNTYAENNQTPFLLLDIYRTKSSEIIDLLSSDSLQFIISLIKNNKIDIAKLPFMDKKDLIKNKIFNKEDKIIEKSKSDTFECPKCKKRNTSINEIQIQRGDEPATVFVTCLECGHVFTL